jgi:hypothetical protein
MKARIGKQVDIIDECKNPHRMRTRNTNETITMSVWKNVPTSVADGKVIFDSYRHEE